MKTTTKTHKIILYTKANFWVDIIYIIMTSALLLGHFFQGNIGGSCWFLQQ